jgi:hypothetical protein
MVLQGVRESRALIHFVRERLPHYGPLISGDLRRFREEIVKATFGASVAIVAGLSFACFLSVATITVVTVPPPFHLVGTALARDYAHFVDSLSSDSGR